MNKKPNNEIAKIICIDCNIKFERLGNATKRCRTCAFKKYQRDRKNIYKIKRNCIQCNKQFSLKVHNQITCGEMCRLIYLKEKYNKCYTTDPIKKVMLSKSL